MDNFKLVSTLKAYADTNEWAFLYGDKFHQNIEASQNTYSAGQYVMYADFDATPAFRAGAIGQITYTGVMALGIKIDEAETVVSLDETYYQKYTSRLENLMIALASYIADFACDNELEITNCVFRADINRFDTNIDFIAASVTFVQ